MAKPMFDELREELGDKVTDRAALAWLYKGLLDAQSRNLALGEIYNPGPHKDAKHGVQKLDRALTKLVGGKGTTEAAHKSLRAGIVDLKRHAPGALTELDAFGLILLPVPELIGPDFKRISVFEQLADRVLAGDAEPLHHLKDATRQFLDSTRNPGRGSAKRSARENIPGIERLAEYFCEACPDRKVSADPSSLFYAYVLFWITHFTGSNIEDPECHIKYAIEEMEKVFLSTPEPPRP